MTQARGSVALRTDANPGLTESTLLGAAATGDASAFDVLIRPRLDRLFRMAFAITRDATDAEDAVQEACVSAWRELPRLRAQERFDSWLNQIVVNASRANIRRRRRVHVREIVFVEPARAANVAGSEASPAEAAGEVQAIRRAFERLDPTMRSLLVLHYVEERPLAEIAAVLGSPVGTVKWRMSKARAALDRALEVERR